MTHPVGCRMGSRADYAELSGYTVVGVGTPEDIAGNPASYTGRYLKPLLT